MGATLLGPLARVSGEDPSASAALPAFGDARTDGSSIRLSLTNLDPVRFPATAACKATVSIGTISAKIGLINVVSGSPASAVTAVHFSRAGTVAAGTRADVQIRCTGRVKRSTRWQGTLR